MPTNRQPRYFRLLPLLAAIGVLLLPLTMRSAQAQDLAALAPLAVGAPAAIVTDPGADALLRDAPGYEAMVVGPYAAGTPVEIIEGPVTASDGSVWYGVAVNGVTGYLAGASLLGNAAAAPVPAEAPAAPVADPNAAPAPGPTTATAPAPAPASDAYATAELNLRTGPSPDDAVVAVIPVGAALVPTGEAANGYLGITYNGQTGWADGAYIGAGAPAAAETTLAETAPPTAAPDSAAPAPAPDAAAPVAAPAAEPAPVADQAAVADPATAPSGTQTTVVSLSNLVAGPAGAETTLRVLPAGSPVTVTGAAVDGYLPVWYNGTTGWIAVPLIAGGETMATTQPVAPAPDATAPTGPAAPATDPAAPASAPSTGEAVNLRATPEAAGEVIGVVPEGVPLTPLSGPENGFYQVSYEGVTGWVASTALDDAAGAAPTSAYNRDRGLERERGGTGMSWPVRSGTWEIMQGYNGSSHQNQDGSWQYYYSLDLVRAEGETAGEIVMAPLAGTVRWLDPSSGGISIDVGNGHAVAFFHVTVDPSLRPGTPLQQGQVVGTISGPGGAGFSGTPHLHFALWETSDGGNWSRSAAPFTGAYRVGGMDFPDIGGSNQYRGTVINV